MITMQLSRPPTVPLSGAKLADVLLKNVAQVNRDGRMKVLSSMEGMEREHISTTGAALVSRELDTFAIQLRQRFPIPKQELHTVGREFLRQILTEYDSKLEFVVSSSEGDRATRRIEIEEALHQRLKVLKYLNLEATTVWIEKIAAQEFRMFRVQFLFAALGPDSEEAKAQDSRTESKSSSPKPRVSASKVSRSTAELDIEYQKLKQRALSRVEMATQAVPGVLDLDVAKQALWAEEEKLLELLSALTVRRHLQEQSQAEINWRQAQADLPAPAPTIPKEPQAMFVD